MHDGRMETLGDLIKALKALDSALPVEMDGASGLGFISWRGNYSEVSIDHGGTRLVSSFRDEVIGGYSYRMATKADLVPAASTVGELLAVANRVAWDPVLLEGYKGDLFEMHDDTTLWADSYGTCPGARLAGVTVVGGVVQLQRSEPES